MTRSFLLNAALIATGLSFAAVGCDDCNPDDTGSDKDIDDDGYIAEEYGGDDCDDEDPSIHPGADEVCDGKDNDCDKLVDDADDSLDLSTTSTWYADADGDGYGRPEDSTQACARPEGYVADNTDCDDTNPSYHPGGLDWLNNDIDEDCDGADATEAWDLEDAPYSVVGRIAREFLGYGMTTCDLDGDEYDDLVVTAPDGNDFHGEIGVFYGSNSSSWSTGMAITDADVYITDRGYLIGDVVACTDVDGDGHLDLVATRSECDYPSIYVESFGIVGWYGSEDDWSPTPGAPDFELSYDLGIRDPSGSRWWREFSVGDIDGDGASEILVAMYPQKNSGAFPGTKECGVWVIPGGTYSGSGDLEDEVCDRYECEDLGWLQNPWVVDLYGDGINEVAIGNQFYSEGNGLVGLLSDPDPDECITADMGALFHTSIVGTEGEYLGFSVAFGEIDLNDGTDAVISAYLNSTGEHYGGALYFFSDVGSLGETGLHASEVADAVVLGDVEECYFPGYNVVTVGDLDGDGYGEVLAGEAYLGSQPSVERSFHLLSGAALANASEPLTPLEADILAWETAATHLMGEEMVSGDFDGDGYGDIAIAQPDYPTGGYPEQGKVFIFLTSDYGL